MAVESPARSKGPPRMKGAWSWLKPHLPGAILELLVFALVVLPATYSWSNVSPVDKWRKQTFWRRRQKCRRTSGLRESYRSSMEG
jgi:hypothetical protein